MADNIWDLGSEAATPQQSVPPSQDSGSDWGHLVKLVTTELGRGAASVPGFAIDVLGNLGFPALHQAPQNILSGQSAASRIVNNAYSQVVPQEAPRNKTEEHVAAISQGIGASVAGGPEMSIWGLGKSALVGAAGGEAAKIAQDNTNSPVAPSIWGLGAGVVTSVLLHHPGANPVKAGMAHPEYNHLVDNVIPALEGGGTIENPKVNPKSGARGPMQVMPETAAKPGHGVEPSNGTAADDVRVGRELFAALLHKYDGDTSKALAAYDWGEGHVDAAVAKHGNQWLAHAPDETRNYVNRGMAMTYGGSPTLGGSTGGPVIPMTPEELAQGMGDIGPAEHPTPKLVADNEAPIQPEIADRLRKVADEHQSINDTIDSHLGEAHAALNDINDGYEPSLTLKEAQNYRQGIEDILNGMDKNHPLRPKAELAAKLWDEVANQFDDGVVSNKPYIDPLAVQGGDKVLGQEPKPVEPANDTTPPAEPPKEPPFGGGGEPPEEPPQEPQGDKYAGSINLNRLQISDAAKENIKQMAAPMNADIETFNETRQKAAELIDKKGVEGVLNTEEVKPDDLAHYATAVRAIHAAAQEHMVRLNEEFLNPESNSDVAHIRWVHAMEVLGKAFDRTQAVHRGLGRGLGALRIEVGGTEGALGEKLSDLMKSRATDEEIARMIQEHPDQAGKIARDAQKPGFSEYAFTTWYAMLLSSLRTLAKNVLSNSLMNIIDTFVVQPTAAGLGKLHGGEKVTFRAAGAGMAGLMQGAVEGLKNAPEAYRRGSPSDFVERTQAYWKPENKGIGRVISAPMRVLSAQDQVFLDAAQNAEYYRMAHIKAAKEGLTGDEYKQRVQDLLANPTAQMNRQAIKYGQMMRFQDPMEFKGLEYITRATKNDPVAIKIMKGFMRLLFPFPRNSDRMFFGAMRNSPLGIIEPQNIRDFRAGGAKRDVAMARVLVGTLAAGAIYEWAANGGITGAGPTDPAKNAQWRRNHMPYSINFPGGVHISYQGAADPFSIMLGAIATTVEKAGEKSESLEQKIFKSATALTGQMMDSTYAMGASQFFQALDDQTGKTFETWLGRMASSVTTPALVREINQSYVDPTVRDTRDHPITDQVKAGVPFFGLSKQLPARHDVYGDVIKRENPGDLNIINPTRVQIDKGDRLSKDIDKVVSDKALITRAPSKINGVKLDASQQEKYQELSGKYLKQMLSEDPGWRFMPPAQKADRIKEILGNARNRAKADLGIGASGHPGDIWSMS